jgi:pimeloyl-ACP methyl ester carboxylesterase
VRQREGFATAFDGTPIFYEVAEGPAGGEPPVALLFDGIGCAGFIWKYLQPVLIDAGFRVVHFHYRGHGRSPAPDERSHLHVTDLADDAGRVLDAVGARRAVVMGHSMGVQVCLEAFRRHRPRIAGVALICGAYGHPLRTFHGRRTLEAVLPFISFLVAHTPKLTGRILKRVLPTRLAYQAARVLELNPHLARLEDFMPYLEHLSELDPTLFLGMLALAGRHTAREVLPQLDVPTLIVAGGRDGFTPATLSQEMHELAPQSELLLIEDGSHTAPLERPELVEHAVRGWLERTRA